MNWMQYIKIKKKYVISSILTYIFLQLIIFSTLLSKCINDLYEYNRATGKNELSNRIAMNLGDLINDTILFKLFLVGVLILTVLPAFSFYQYYVGEKSIYTILRLPRKSTRFKIYLAQIYPTIIGLLALWFLQLVLLFIFYFMYVGFVPNGNQPINLWNNLWLSSDVYVLYPFMKPINFIANLSVLLYFPSSIMLMVLAERSRKQCIEAILVILLALYGLYRSSSSLASYDIIIFPFITLTTIGTGLYYMYRKQIV